LQVYLEPFLGIIKLIQPIIGSNPKEILKTLLDKGKITLEEYEKIKSKLY